MLPEASGVPKLVVSLPKGRFAMKGEMFTASTRLHMGRLRHWTLAGVRRLLYVCGHFQSVASDSWIAMA